MVQTEQITFYSHIYSPYGQRVHIALEEANAAYTFHSIDLMNKPAFYTKEVNPVGKIPAITYGGPKVDPEQPSPESTKLRESGVILEFLADLFPDSGLLPKDPVLRAKARLFITVVDGQPFEGFKGYFFMREPATKLIDGLDALQKQLPATGFAVGEKWTIADIAIAPFLARIFLLLENDLGVYPAGDGKKTLEILRGEKFARLNKYYEDVKAQSSFKATWDEDTQTTIWKSNPMFKRE
ncbi:uncharacterized protein PHACADRAFT_265855 [Phanerochaete carnosa HHB-10118-sp]|uniref:GST N-terminal domain-containing protein n=1 Tax=Phanerochaete carnosa (strain HHB-10118-sp) TaxID=650164 RepID=K5VQQ5_PHACS|nr:uncharacterized protein PHACADRAFT_265855 [Phanerochaete carnosa HHB-10118-sp]EKM49075.1 hypothetical protein PHACADRAFT_265855 [Phanerochaete carnosa HHB-10118-sp]